MATVSKLLSNDLKPQRPSLLQTENSTSSSTSHSTTPSSETKAVDVRSSIPEEEEDETASETGNEPVTPTDTHHGHAFRDTSNDALHENSHNDGSQAPFQQVNSKVPPLLSTAATPPQGAKTENSTAIRTVDSTPPPTSSQSLPMSSNQSQPGLKRGFSGFFRRSNSHMSSNVTDSSALTHGAGGSDTMLSGTGRRLSTRGASTQTSPNTTRSNSPPSPGSPTKDGNMLAPSQTAEVQPQSSQFLSGKTKNRSSTGLGIRNRLYGITFATSSGPKRPQQLRHRSTSVDMDSAQSIPSVVQAELTRNPYAIGPGAGTGLKARRMSLNLPDDFTVDVVDLHSEFSNQSKMLGRRGKTLGKGATSTVALMIRKGFGNELYAVKEFRGKQSTEKEEDYEKKIKSEFSIAKSLHHPNVVETVRLCTDSGKWNHVMEYCEEGDLYSVVQKGYLKAKVQDLEKDPRKADRLCLFKQLVQGVQYLHCHGIAHRDIKLENLLMTKDSKLKITDFGVSEVFSGIHPGLRAAGGQCGKDMAEVRRCEPGICGSMPYIAPEVVLKKGDYDPRPLDVWSSAIVMIHIIFGGAIWPEAKEGQGHKHYDGLVKGWAKWEVKHPDGCSLEDDYPHVEAFDKMVYPPALRRLLVGMLHPDPTKRSTIEDIANNRWMKQVECCQVNSYDDPAVVIDASKKTKCLTSNKLNKVVLHNHLPPTTHKGHHLIRLPGSTDM